MRIMVLLLCASCAYGIEQPTKVYGHSNPQTTTDAEAPDFSNANSGNPANDPEETGCIVQNIFDGPGAPVGYVLICDGRPFTFRDEIDPPIDGKQK